MHEMKTWFATAGAVALVACSGQSPEGEPRYMPAAEALDGDAREAAFQAQLEGELSLAERDELLAALQHGGIDASEVGFTGRLVTIGDMMIEADSVLDGQPLEVEAVDKGRVVTQVYTIRSVDGLPVAPDIFATTHNGNFLFHRPDVGNTTIVVPNGSTASFLVQGFRNAANAIWGAASDCLNTNQVHVKTQSQYDAMSELDKMTTKPIFVRYGAQRDVCPTLTNPTGWGCSLMPREERRDFEPGIRTTRMVPGPRIGLLSSRIAAPLSAVEQSILTHELMHTLGVAHADIVGGTTRVPGTSDDSDICSIMYNECSLTSRSCNYNYTLTPDDVDTIDTLFSPPSGSNCAYRREFQVISPIGAEHSDSCDR